MTNRNLIDMIDDDLEQLADELRELSSYAYDRNPNLRETLPRIESAKRRLAVVQSYVHTLQRRERGE